MIKRDKINPLLNQTDSFKKVLEETLYIIALEFTDENNEEEIYECLLFLIDAIKNVNKQKPVSPIQYFEQHMHLNLLVYRQAKIDYPINLLPRDSDIFIPSMNVLITNEELRNYVIMIKQMIIKNQDKINNLLKIPKI